MGMEFWQGILFGVDECKVISSSKNEIGSLSVKEFEKLQTCDARRNCSNW